MRRSMRCMSRHLALWTLLLWPHLAAADDLYSQFQSPPTRLRPFVRWWWNGARVAEGEILRELDVMKAAGIGGVEINTIAMVDAVPAETLTSFPALTWLSPEWNRMVRVAADGARERGMVADLIVGSGWPFGGRFLLPAEQTQRVSLVKRAVTGPSTFDADLRELTSRSRREREEVPTVPEVAFLRLVPRDLTTFAPGTELRPSVSKTGRLRTAVPAGDWALHIGLLETGFTHVKLGAPGADGPVVNHFDARAVRRYLDHMSSAITPALGGRMGGPLRAAFVDSLELDRANWVSDLPREFEARRGYALAPYLPFVLDAEAVGGETPLADTVRRARYDFIRTLVELFQERFLTTYAAWCRDNGLLSRIQAYGRESHPLEASLLVDLPEGESWLWSDHDRITVSPTVVDKYVSSAAHLGGKRIVSFEAMTNAVPAFREMPEDFKLGLDMSLLAGVHQPVLHGFNYTPPEAGYPGWVRFGCYFNEKASWWPHFRRFTDYAARLTAVLASSEAQAQIAILGPRADEWARHGTLYQPFPEVAEPWYHYALWQAFEQNGCGSDFVSERIVQEASAEAGRLRYGSRTYEALVLQGVESLEPETARAVERFAKSGGRVVFVGRAPSRSAGLRDAEAKDRQVREAVAAALAADPSRVAVVPEPNAGPLGTYNHVRLGLPEFARRALLTWARDAMSRFGIEPRVRLAAPHPAVSLVQHEAEGRKVFFFANTSRSEAASFEARFPTGDATPWRWDPETGERASYPHGARADSLWLHLGPAESLLLVFENALPSKEPTWAVPAALPEREWLKIRSAWDVELRPAGGGGPFRRRIDTLGDFSVSSDPALADFGGLACYRTEFESPKSELALLDLGEVHGVSAVRLNGKPLGVRWWGRHVYDAAGALQKGSNSLEVDVTTTIGNQLRSMTANPVAKRWAWWFPPIPAGLVGPVRLVRPGE
jgi:hypothetical protein